MAARPARRWFPLLRAVLGLARTLRAIETQLTRLADAAEGLAPTARLAARPEAPEADVYTTPYRNDAELARIELIEREMAPILGRLPDADEVVAALDGVEWTEGDAAAHRERVAKWVQKAVR